MRLVKHAPVAGLILGLVLALMAAGATPQAGPFNARYQSCYLQRHPHQPGRESVPALLTEVRHSLWLVGEFPRCGPEPLLLSTRQVGDWFIRRLH